MKVALLILIWTVLLLAAGGVALHLWLDLEGVSLGFHGWLALGLGVGVSLVLGVGLMALVFLSARRGYDDAGGASGGGKRDERARGRDDAQR